MPSYSGNVVEAFIEDLLFPVSTANPDEEHLDFDEKSEVEYHHHKLVSFVCEEDEEMTYEHDANDAFKPTPQVPECYSYSSSNKKPPPKQVVVKSMYDELNERAARRTVIQLEQAQQRQKYQRMKEKIEIEKKKKLLQYERVEQRFRYECMTGIHQKQRKLKQQKQMTLQRQRKQRMMAASPNVPNNSRRHHEHRHNSKRYAESVPNRYIPRGSNNSIVSLVFGSCDLDSAEKQRKLKQQQQMALQRQREQRMIAASPNVPNNSGRNHGHRYNSKRYADYAPNRYVPRGSNNSIVSSGCGSCDLDSTDSRYNDDAKTLGEKIDYLMDRVVVDFC